MRRDARRSTGAAAAPRARRTATAARRGAGTRGGDDDAAQIMLLAAILLVLGILALAGMAARVSNLATTTTAEVGRPITLEASHLIDTLEDLPGHLIDAGYTFCQDDHDDFDAALDAAFAHVTWMEAGRGFLFSAEATYIEAATKLEIEILLRDGRVEITAELDHVDVPAC